MSTTTMSLGCCDSLTCYSECCRRREVVSNNSAAEFCALSVFCILSNGALAKFVLYQYVYLISWKNCRDIFRYKTGFSIMYRGNVQCTFPRFAISSLKVFYNKIVKIATFLMPSDLKYHTFYISIHSHLWFVISIV